MKRFFFHFLRSREAAKLMCVRYSSWAVADSKDLGRPRRVRQVVSGWSLCLNLESRFIDNRELGWVQAVMNELRAPSVVENHRVARNLNGGGDSSFFQTGRDGDETLRTKTQLGTGFSSLLRYTISGDLDVEERKPVYRC